MGHKSFVSPQKEALKPLMEGQNALICIPTASGKSLLAYLSIIKQIIVMKPGTQAVYIVPLKALAREKYEDLKALSEKLGIRVSLGVGDAGEMVVGFTVRILWYVRLKNWIR